MKHILLLLALLLCALPAWAQQPSGSPGAVPVMTPVERPDAATNVSYSRTTSGTITLTAGAAGTNTQSVYITGIDIANCASASAVAAAAATFITTTGLNGSPQYMIGSGQNTAGLCVPVSIISFSAPLKSATPGTNVTFVLPAFATNQTVSVNVYYRLGW